MSAWKQAFLLAMRQLEATDNELQAHKLRLTDSSASEIRLEKILETVTEYVNTHIDPAVYGYAEAVDLLIAEYQKNYDEAKFARGET